MFLPSLRKREVCSFVVAVDVEDVEGILRAGLELEKVVNPYVFLFYRVLVEDE